MTAEVVRLPRTNLKDIPERLRWLADEIESGRLESVEALYVLIPQIGDFPKLYGWGAVEGMHDPIVQLELCKHWLITNQVSR